jgi:hypothetical protein
METPLLYKKLRELRVTKNDLAIAQKVPRPYITGLFSQEEIADSEAKKILDVAIRLSQDRIATIVD